MLILQPERSDTLESADLWDGSERYLRSCPQTDLPYLKLRRQVSVRDPNMETVNNDTLAAILPAAVFAGMRSFFSRAVT